jgi:lysophospholipase L1-like esterase
MRRITTIFLLLLAIIYLLESNDTIGLSKYKPVVDLEHTNSNYTLTWSKMPYLAYYEVEVLNRNVEQDTPNTSAYCIAKYRTFKNSISIDQPFPDGAYLRISAHSLFHHPLGAYSDSMPISDAKLSTNGVPFRPTAISNYPANAPAPNIPLLTWTVLPGAVYYELELLSAPPENPNDILPSRYQLFSSRRVYTNSHSVNLSNFPGNQLFWRVRGLDYDGNPLGVFSNATKIFIDHKLPQVLKPISNTGYSASQTPMPLYPVYSWTPIAGAVNYEVEVTSEPPENSNGTQPSQHRIRQRHVKISTDCYDEEPLITPGTYYWRVRGLDENGNAVGVYSDAEGFLVDRAAGKYAATFGDSITHGGGAISYSPANVEYDFQTYLSFHALNIGKSGDTSEAMANRFDDDVLPYHPKFLIIMGGSNSLRGGIPASQVIKDLSTIRDKCTYHGIRPIFLTLPPINPIAIYNAFNEETAPNWQAEFTTVNAFIRQQRYYIDLEPYFADGTHDLPLHFATDGLHLDMDGKKLMAQIINANWERVTQDNIPYNIKK